jgi:formate--tetrahydrofolate ligase
MFRSDLEIAQERTLKPVSDIAALLGLAPADLTHYGPHIAKVHIGVLDRLKDRPDGKLILVTAMTPTSKGEGKTTTTIGLGQALWALKKKAIIAVREPALGPCFGLKGGAAGGGYSQVLPMEDINLHFTGDLHAVTTAHNLLSAALDNHIHQDNVLGIDPRDVVWKRTIDMNDRSLRNILIGLGNRGANGALREDGFEIIAASEVMAVLCLSRSLADLKERLGRILVGYDRLGKPVFATDLGAHGAMAALLKNAIHPNLVQSLEGTPVFVHGGPFANIAHGCNTLIATTLALKLGDYVVTEAGFASDLGAEKFFDIKCRAGNLKPSCAVLVVTRRAFEMHGIDNVAKHIENVRHYNLEPIVSLNKFLDDTPGQLLEMQRAIEGLGAVAVVTDYREQGSQGGLELAAAVVKACAAPSRFAPLYPLDLSLEDKVTTIATKIYGAASVTLAPEARRQFKRLTDLGFADLPVCVAKTQSSLSDNAKLRGRPRDFTLTVTNAKVSRGAGFVVVYAGDIMTMPGLPKEPALLHIDVDADGRISGLF